MAVLMKDHYILFKENECGYCECDDGMVYGQSYLALPEAEKATGFHLFQTTASFYSLFLEELAKSSDKELSAIAKKSIKEVTYHFRHSSQWVIRLGAGTEESHNKMNMALNKLWQFTEEFFIMDEIDIDMVKKKIGVNREALKSKWIKKVDDILKEATLEKPKDIHMLLGGKKGIHTEHLGHILSDMQYLQRAYPDAKW